MGRLSIVKLCIVILAFQAANTLAACTYNEAIMAKERGNQFRALALMKIAARDGDQRAKKLLANWLKQNNKTLATNRNKKELEKYSYQRLVMDTATDNPIGTEF